MDSLRNPQANFNQRKREPNPLSVSRGPREHLAFSPSSLSGTPKSYESSSRLPIQTRPPATQYNVPETSTSPQVSYVRKNIPYSNTSTNFGTSINSYSRPSSAMKDHVVSPIKYNGHGRQVHSPTYGSTLLPEPYESVKSPRATSPNRSPHPPGPRPRPGRNMSNVDGFETTQSTPPHSPAAPRSPKGDERNFKVVDDMSPSSYVPGRPSYDTLKQEDRDRYLPGLATEEGTIVAPRDVAALDSRSTSISVTPTAASQPPSRTTSPPRSASTSPTLDLHHDESSDDGGNGTWIVKPQSPLQSEEKPKLKVQIATPTTARPSPSKESTATLIAATSDPKRNNNPSFIDETGNSKRGILSEIMKEREGGRENENAKEKEWRAKETEKAWEKEHNQLPQETSDMFVDEEDGWAMRPPPEAVYEKLELYFRNHDLDKPVIEANSGGASPTSIEPPFSSQAAVTSASNYDKDKEREKCAKIRSKKSIRYVAEDAKRRIDRTSKADSTFADIYSRKRNTKFWGGKLEEVTTHQARSSSVSSTTPASSSGSKL